MNGLIRPHQLSAGDALDRRRLEENFLYLAQRLNSPNGEAVGDRVLVRQDFLASVWQQFRGTHIQNMHYAAERYSYVIPDSLDWVECNDGNFEGEYVWSMAVSPIDDTESQLLWAWPVIDGQAVWGGADILVKDTVYQYDYATGGADAIDPTDPTNVLADYPCMETSIPTSMSGKCVVTGRNGRFPIGVMVSSIGRFKITSFTAYLKEVVR